MRSSERPGELAGALRVATFAGILFGLTGTGSAAVAVVVPAITDALEVQGSAGSWVISTYAVTLAMGTAVHGRMADRWGIRRTLAIGVWMMAIGAVLAAFATTFPLLIAARAIQGVGAAAVPVLVVALVTARFEGEVLTRGLTRLSGTAILVGATGPLCGGLLELVGGWRLVMCLPALAPLVLLVLWPGLPTAGAPVRIDVVGAVLVMVVAGAVVVALQTVLDAESVPLLGAAVAAVLLAVPLLVIWTTRRPDGFVPLAVVRTGDFIWPALAASTVPAAWFGLLVAIPSGLADRGWSAVAIGASLVPSALVGVLAPRVAAHAIRRTGPLGAVAVATTLACTGLVMSAVGAAHSEVLLIAGMVPVNLAFAIGQPALGAAVATSTQPHVRSSAMGIATLVFFVGGGAGAAIAGLGPVVGAATAVLAVAALPFLATCVVLVVRARVRAAQADTESTEE